MDGSSTMRIKPQGMAFMIHGSIDKDCTEWISRKLPCDVLAEFLMYMLVEIEFSFSVSREGES
ncbi:hypothetical protein N9137_00825 [Pseudomonadales bacterium]|nr:hypothetical protein [Pseudomonadales bacterium]